MEKSKKWELYGLIFFFLILGLLFFLGLGNMLLPLTFSFFLSYLLFPLLWVIEKRLPNREVAILLVFFVALAAFFLFFFLLLPPLFREIKQLTREFPHLLEVALFKLEHLSQQWGLDLPLDPTALLDQVKNYSSHLSLGGLRPLAGFLKNSFANIATALINILNFFLIPLFTFHILRDYEKMLERMNSLIPLKWKPWADQFLENTDNILSGHIRGQLLVGFVLGVLYAVGLSLIGLKFAITIGFISGFLNIIPYLGTLLGFSLAFFMSLTEFSLGFLLQIMAVFIIVQTLEGTLITPKVVGDKVGLGPLATLIGLIIGGNLGGILGLMVAVPVTAVLKIIVVQMIEVYHQSSLYGEGEG